MLKRVWHLYYDGFRDMPRWGKMLWAIILIKVLILFFVFKFLLMPNYLNTHYATDRADARRVITTCISAYLPGKYRPGGGVFREESLNLHETPI